MCFKIESDLETFSRGQRFLKFISNKNAAEKLIFSAQHFNYWLISRSSPPLNSPTSAPEENFCLLLAFPRFRKAGYMSRYNKLVGFFFEEFWSVFLRNMFEGRENTQLRCCSTRKALTTDCGRKWIVCFAQLEIFGMYLSVIMGLLWPEASLSCSRRINIRVLFSLIAWFDVVGSEINNALLPPLPPPSISGMSNFLLLL